MTEPAGLTHSADAETLRNLIDNRRAIRRFTAEPVPEEVIRDCLEMAMLAPNSCNLQPWSFVVMRDPALLQQLHPVCLKQHAAKAPLIIAVLARPDTWKTACDNILQYWPEETTPRPIQQFYTRIAPLQYNQGLFGWRGLLKRCLVWLTGLRQPLMRKPNSHAEMKLWAVKSTALAAQNLMMAFQSHGYGTCPMEGFDEVRLRKMIDLPKRAIPIMLLAVGKPGEKAIYNPRLRFPMEQQVEWL